MDSERSQSRNSNSSSLLQFFKLYEYAIKFKYGFNIKGVLIFCYTKFELKNRDELDKHY